MIDFTTEKTFRLMLSAISELFSAKGTFTEILGLSNLLSTAAFRSYCTVLKVNSFLQPDKQITIRKISVFFIVMINKLKSSSNPEFIPRFFSMMF